MQTPEGSGAKKKKGGGAVVVGPGGRDPGQDSYSAPAGSASSGSGSGSSTGSSGGGGGNSYASAMAAANRKAAARYRRQAKNLEAQAKALRHALRVDLKKGLLQQLADINQVSKQQDKIIRQGFRERMGSLLGAAEDNTKAAEAQTGINEQNLVRERNSALSEAMAQGAGESDALRAMMMSLRNWNANQTEIERGYFDTLRSIQSGQTDLETDTRTALVNNAIQRNSDKEMLWTNYYNQRSEIWTQLGNVRGQQADYYAMANEYGGGGGGGRKGKKDGDQAGVGGKEHRGGMLNRATDGGGKGKGGGGGGGVNAATAQAAHAFMQASKELGRSWDNPGVSKRIMRWDGAEDIASTRTQAPGLQAIKTVSLDKKPEGATLRKW